MKQAYILIASILLAVATVAILEGVDASPAAAAEGGLVRQCGGGQIFLDGKEKQTFVLHNRIRRERNLPTFCVDPKLTEAAEFHSDEMISKGNNCDYFDPAHRSYDCASGRFYEDFAQRIERFDYPYRTVGENIAWGSGSLGSPENIMKSWMKSDGHRKNILNKNFREIGIGVVDGEYKGYGNATMYTVDFGTKL